MTNHHAMNASVPQHLYGFVRRTILQGLEPDPPAVHPETLWRRILCWIFRKRIPRPKRYEPCVIFGVTSIPSRALHFSILCESGAQWARIPLHMLRWELPDAGAPVHPLTDLQMWDAHGWDFAVCRYEYLREMGCAFRKRDGSLVNASYWFTLDHSDNGYSQYPPEHKCYHLLLLEDGSGQIAAQPNNRILWKDDSFVKPGHPLDYRVMAPNTWHAETSRRNAHDTAFCKD